MRSPVLRVKQRWGRTNIKGRWRRYGERWHVYTEGVDSVRGEAKSKLFSPIICTIVRIINGII